MNFRYDGTCYQMHANVSLTFGFIGYLFDYSADKRKGKGRSKSKKVKKINGKAKLDREDPSRAEEAHVADNVESSTALQSTSGGDSEEGELFADDEDDGELSDEVFELTIKEKSQPSLHSSACKCFAQFYQMTIRAKYKAKRYDLKTNPQALCRRLAKRETTS